MRLFWLLLAVAAFAVVCGCCESPPDTRVTEVAHQAIAEKNPDLCNNLTYDYQKHDCYGQVAIGLQDSSLCNRIPENTTKDNCRYNVAVNASVFGTCLEIQDDTTKALCVGQVASDKAEGVEKGIEEGWDKVKNFFSGGSDTCATTEQSKRDSCYKYAAVNADNPSLCEKIQGDKAKTDCYRRIGVARKDPSVCESLPEGANRDSCLYTSAFQTDDTNFCAGIQSTFYRERCYRVNGIESTPKPA